MENYKNKISEIIKLVAILCAVVIVSGTFTMPDYVYADDTEKFNQDYTYEAEDEGIVEGTRLIGSEIPDLNSDYKALIDYYRIKDGTKYKGSGECYGYAEMMRKRFGSGARKVIVNKKGNGKNLYKYLKDVKPGTHVRFKYPSGSYVKNHSWCVYKVTEDKIYYSDANIGFENDIFFYVQEYNRHETGQSWTLQWYMEPKGSYRSSSTDIQADVSDTENKITLVWKPIKNAKKYTIYRSYSKNGKYTKIGTSKSPRFIDRKAKFRTVYYKIKTGNYTSKPSKVSHRLISPTITMSHNAAGYVTLSWDKIEGASKYVLYERVYSNTKPYLRFKKIASTSNTKLTLKKNLSVDSVTLRAIHKSNSKLNSYNSGNFIPGSNLGRVAPKPRIESIVSEDENFYISVNVTTPKANKDSEFMKFYLFRSDSKDGYYELVSDWGSTAFDDSEGRNQYSESTVYTVHDWVTSLPENVTGKTYYYKVVAKNENGYGLFSKPVAFTVPENKWQDQE